MSHTAYHYCIKDQKDFPKLSPFDSFGASLGQWNYVLDIGISSH